MKKALLAGIYFLFSLFLFASVVHADCGQPHESSEPPAPSAPPTTPSGGEGGGSVGDQLGKTFEPPGGGIGTEPTLSPKKYSKNSPEMRGLKKMEHQVKVDKRNVHRAREDAGKALRDFSDAKRETERAGGKITTSQPIRGEKERRLLEKLTESLRNDARAENRFNEKDREFSESLKSSDGNVRQAKERAAETLRDFSEARQQSIEMERQIESTMTGDRSEKKNPLEGLREAVRNEINAENRFEGKQQKFNEALDKFGESSDRYEAMQREMTNGR